MTRTRSLSVLTPLSGVVGSPASAAPLAISALAVLLLGRDGDLPVQARCLRTVPGGLGRIHLFGHCYYQLLFGDKYLAMDANNKNDKYSVAKQRAMGSCSARVLPCGVPCSR
eukprot:gene58187-biopygen37313